MKILKLSNSMKVALVDDEDFQYLARWKWQLHTGGYAYRNGSVYMHRVINQTPEGLVTDHINGNKLDNRKQNLRTATKSLNATNTGLRKTNKSGYTGVAWSRSLGCWEAYIWKDRVKLHLGLYEDKKDAIETRRKAELAYHV